jgi:hypothetical protein
MTSSTAKQILVEARLTANGPWAEIEDPFASKANYPLKEPTNLVG